MSRITLTIDNGPHATETPAVLDVLSKRGIRAHFFVVGAQAAKPGGMEILEQIVRAGHVVGNHTWSHRVPFGENADPNAVADEVVRTAGLLEQVLSTPGLFRPFGGGGRLDACLFSPALISHLCAEGYTCALWNNVPRDWQDPDGWVDKALATAADQDWSVVVVHDYLAGNAPRIARFIDQAQAAGHEFCDDIAPDCLPIVAGEIVQDLRPLTSEVG